MKITKDQEVLQQVINEAWSNPAFKQELINSPEAAIRKLTGAYFNIPEGKTLQVFDQSNTNVICLNIPQQPSTDNLELTDKELEMVAGGQILPFLPDDGIGCFVPRGCGFPWDGTTPPYNPIDPIAF